MTEEDNSHDTRIVRGLRPSPAIERRPFRQRAQDLGLEEDELVEGIQALLAGGIIRRYGATVRHRSMGYKSNVLVAWSVPDERVEEFASVIDLLDEVSHGYVRMRYPEWDYNIYTMIHGHSKNECLGTVKHIADALVLNDYVLLFTKQELKKCTLDVPALLARG